MTQEKLITQWIKEARYIGATHIISVCNILDYIDYPVYVNGAKALQKEITHYRQSETHTINEIIDISKIA